MFMGKATIQIPLITLRIERDDVSTMRPRFSPGPRLRRPPFSMKGEDLRHPDGRWFSLEEAIAWSRDRQALIDQLAGATPKQARQLRRVPGHETLGQLFEAFLAQPRMRGKTVVEGRKERRPLATNTVKNYAQGARRFETLDNGRIWNAPAAALTASIMAGVLDRIEVKHGLASTRKARAAASAMFTWAIAERNFKGQHAFKDSGHTLPTAAPRIRIGEKAEILQLIRAADLLGRPEIGDSITLGVWTAQRQNDRLAISEAEESSQGITFRQHKKHGQPIVVPPAPELRARLAAMRHRRRHWKVTYPQLIVDEVARAPFKTDWYVKVFAQVRSFAATGMVHSRLKGGRKGPLVPARHAGTGDVVTIAPMPSLADFHDQDLRDTAITWLALAECSIPQIAAITGHSLETINSVLKHYLGMHPELARSAIAKLVAWYEVQGEAK